MGQIMRLFEIANNFKYLPVDEYMLEDEGYDYYDIVEQCLKLVKQSGMNMLSDDEFDIFALVDNKVIGVLYKSINGDELTWSIAVSQQYRNKGVASNLYSRMDVPDFVNTLKAELIPPYTLEQMVVKYGYKLLDQVNGFKIYTKPV